MFLSRSFAFAGPSFGKGTGTTALSISNARLRRALWTAATCSHPDLATALSRCFPASDPSISTPTDTKNSVTIVLASRSYPGNDLLDLPAKLPAHIAQSSIILGAVVDRVPTHSGHGVSTLTLTPTSTSATPSSGRLIACQPFYLSGAESRRKRMKEKSVGKWARSQDIEERSLDTADAWSAFKSISTGRNQVKVPEAVLPPHPSSASSSSEQGSMQDILMISDLEVHQFLEALDASNLDASKVGLLASSTPFITGRPVTMFYDGKVVQDGVLGVSMIKDATRKDGDDTSRTSVEYPSLAPLGPAMQITRCRGNIILELDESNATRLLLDRLQTTTLTKDKEYFLATGDPISATGGSDLNIDMTKATVHKITGGDPSKGNMAVDTVHDLQEGQWVQFIHHDKDVRQGHYNPLQSNSQASLRFSSTDPNNTIEGISTEPHQQDAEEPVQAVFGGSSENGFIMGQPEGQTWVCNVTDSVMKHTF